MSEYEYIKTQLQRRQKQRLLSIVAMQSGVCRTTLHWVLRGRGLHSETLRILGDYLRKTARKKTL